MYIFSLRFRSLLLSPSTHPFLLTFLEKEREIFARSACVSFTFSSEFNFNRRDLNHARSTRTITTPPRETWEGERSSRDLMAERCTWPKLCQLRILGARDNRRGGGERKGGGCSVYGLHFILALTNRYLNCVSRLRPRPPPTGLLCNNIVANVISSVFNRSSSS